MLLDVCTKKLPEGSSSFSLVSLVTDLWDTIYISKTKNSNEPYDDLWGVARKGVLRESREWQHGSIESIGYTINIEASL